MDNLYGAYARVETGSAYVGETAPVVRRSDVKVIAFYLRNSILFPKMINSGAAALPMDEYD